MRVVHCKREPYDVYIGRGRAPEGKGRGGWGNPYSHLVLNKGTIHVATHDEAIAKYEAYVRGKPNLLGRLYELKGKTLGCWCAPLSCHGDVLVRLCTEFCP